MPHKPIIKPNIKKDPKILIYKLAPLLPLWPMISNGYRTEWSPIRSVIIRRYYKGIKSFFFYHVHFHQYNYQFAKFFVDKQLKEIS